jgi:acyl-coenzyme A thioesterase 9
MLTKYLPSRVFSTTALLHSYSHELNVNQFFAALKATSVKDGEPKRMKDSYIEDFLLFKTNRQQMGRYWRFGGGIRIGRILEDLDAVAGKISLKHAFTNSVKERLQCVTASLDRIEMVRDLDENLDYKVYGNVVYVGKSSMEVLIKMTSIPLSKTFKDCKGFNLDLGQDNLVMTARFVMVALDHDTRTSIKVPRLLLETDTEKDLYAIGEARRARKQLESEISLLKKPPTVQEMYEIHDIFLKTQIEKSKCLEGSVKMKATENQSLIITHPQDKNLYDKVFGGYLMRQAYEHAYVSAILTCKVQKINFVSLDDISFLKPVNVGSILSFHSRIVYTTSTICQVYVEIRVVDPASGTVDTTNDFYFNFAVDECENVPRVLPESYEEAVAYIEGQRRAKKIKN